MKRSLSVQEFVNVASGAYPTLRFDADQWGERGYFYDPCNRQFGSYSIDRKEQCDEVETVSGPDELLANHCSAERRTDVQAWLRSFRIGAFANETLIWYPAYQQLARFPLVVSPLVVDGALPAVEALTDGYARQWLREQIDRPGCSACAAYFGQWRSHGPSFPDEAFDIVEKREIEVGTHAAVTAMEGLARCRACGQLADFGCEYGPGYWFSPKPAA